MPEGCRGGDSDHAGQLLQGAGPRGQAERPGRPGGRAPRHELHLQQDDQGGGAEAALGEPEMEAHPGRGGWGGRAGDRPGAGCDAGATRGREPGCREPGCPHAAELWRD